MERSEQQRNAVVLTVDGLRPSMLGPYGNTWFETGNFSRLAAESTLFEQCIVDCPELHYGFRSMWTGTHACQADTKKPHLIEAVNAKNVETILLTSGGSDMTSLTGEYFDQIIEVDAPAPAGLAASFDSTQLAEFFAAAVSVIENIQPPTLLWLNCQALTTAWDAPYAIREQLADAEDPDPLQFFLPPDLEFNPANDDPDQLLGFQQAYGAQVILLDQFLGVLLDQLDSTNWGRDAMMCVTAGRGYPLGEHGVVGFYRPILNAELIHVPLIIRWPQQSHPGLRDQSLVQTGSLYRLLGQWFDCLPGNPVESPAFPTIATASQAENCQRQAICSLWQSDITNYESIQTRAWKYIRGSKRQLFVRPDDRWEFNEVHDLCPAIADQLDHLLTAGIQRLMSNQPFLESSLADQLAYGVS